jgi:hypothetical protein
MSWLSSITPKKVKTSIGNAFQPISPVNASYVPGYAGTVDPLSKIFSLNSSAFGRGVSPYAFYLDILSQWPTAPALASMWLVVFNLQSITALTNDPGFLVSEMDSGDFQPWQVSQGTVDVLKSAEYQQSTEQLMGCVFAQEVNIPGETINISAEGLDYAGLLAPNTSKTRNKLEKLKVSFLETNASFCDLIIRPWLILVSHYGLVARAPNSPKNVKCNFMDIVQFAKSGPNTSATIRKLIRYYDVVPSSIGPSTISRAEEGLKRRDVTFAYNGYSVMESGTAKMI